MASNIQPCMTLSHTWPSCSIDSWYQLACMYYMQADAMPKLTEELSGPLKMMQVYTLTLFSSPSPLFPYKCTVEVRKLALENVHVNPNIIRARMVQPSCTKNVYAQTIHVLKKLKLRFSNFQHPSHKFYTWILAIGYLWTCAPNKLHFYYVWYAHAVP